MPYIKQEARLELDEGAYPTTVGELNYLLTRQMIKYVSMQTSGVRGALNYQIINDVMGALESAKLEFYRRIAVPYEETKRKDNGDVYPS